MMSETVHVFRKKMAVLSLLVLLATGIQSCTPKISPFNETAYQQAVQLKVKSLNLISNADKPFSDYKDAVELLKTELNIAHEYAKGRPNNDFTIEQWNILLDENRNMLGGFLKRWEQAGSVSSGFMEEAKENIAQAFDTIIGLESGKIKKGE